MPPCTAPRLCNVTAKGALLRTSLARFADLAGLTSLTWSDAAAAMSRSLTPPMLRHPTLAAAVPRFSVCNRAGPTHCSGIRTSGGAVPNSSTGVACLAGQSAAPSIVSAVARHRYLLDGRRCTINSTVHSGSSSAPLRTEEIETSIAWPSPSSRDSAVPGSGGSWPIAVPSSRQTPTPG
jgi:hypothetical protein